MEKKYRFERLKRFDKSNACESCCFYKNQACCVNQENVDELRLNVADCRQIIGGYYERIPKDEY